MKQKDRPHGEFVPGSNGCYKRACGQYVQTNIPHIKLHALNNFKVLLIKFFDTSLKEDRSV